jgi:hypothetical protein
MSLASQRLRRAVLSLILLGALALHLGLIGFGYHRISNDEAARVLIALDLDWANVLEPFIWPPFYKLLVGLALKLEPDPFWVPRALAIAAALGLIPVVAGIAARISSDPRVVICAALLAVVLPYRLVLGTVPLSDIYYLLFTAWAALCVLAWLQKGRRSTLFGACLLLAVASTVRYEVVFFSAFLGLLLAWRWWRGRGIRFGTLVGAGVLLCAFPALWVANSWAWYGSLSNLSITSEQFLGIAGPDRQLALRLNPLGQPLLQELFWNPATPLGLVACAALAWRQAALRAWAFVFGTPLPVLSAVMVASFSIPLAASWRTIGIWSLLLQPFAALALVRIADMVAARLHPPRTAAVLAAIMALALLPPAWRDLRLLHFGMYNFETSHWREEADIGRAALAELGRIGGEGRILVDSLDNLDFLDLIVGSGKPERFVTSADAPPARIATHVPMRRHYLAENRADIIARYLDDHFDLGHGGNPARLAERNIRLVLAREPSLRAALDSSPFVERRSVWADWTLYHVRPEALVQAQRLDLPRATTQTETR